jgi:hypothetical protein
VQPVSTWTPTCPRGTDAFEKRISVLEDIKDAESAIEIPPLLAASIAALQDAEKTAMIPGHLLAILRRRLIWRGG